MDFPSVHDMFLPKLPPVDLQCVNCDDTLYSIASDQGTPFTVNEVQ
jgi:hypothetical protein